jgi:hypothetical protein
VLCLHSIVHHVYIPPQKTAKERLEEIFRIATPITSVPKKYLMVGAGEVADEGGIFIIPQATLKGWPEVGRQPVNTGISIQISSSYQSLISKGYGVTIGMRILVRFLDP